MKLSSLLSLAILSFFVTGTCYAATPMSDGNPTANLRFLRAPAPLTPELALRGGTTLTPPQLVAASFNTVEMQSRGSDGMARLAGRSFGEAAHSAAHGDGFGVFIYTFIGVIALAAVIVYILAGEDDGGDYKKSKLPPMFGFSW